MPRGRLPKGQQRGQQWVMKKRKRASAGSKCKCIEAGLGIIMEVAREGMFRLGQRRVVMVQVVQVAQVVHRLGIWARQGIRGGCFLIDRGRGVMVMAIMGIRVRARVSSKLEF